MTVDLVTIHHEGAGVPTNYPRGADGGYSIWIGTTNYTLLRAPEVSFATKHFNHVSLDVCLSGNHQVVPLSTSTIELVRRGVADARNRGWVTDHPNVEPHRASFSTACPGDQTMTRWSEVVAACHTPVALPVPKPKVTPMYDPAIVVVGGIAASADDPKTHGVWIFGKYGHVYRFEGANDIGSLNGQSFWGDREVAQAKTVNYGTRLRKRWGVRITATTDETYDLRPKV